MRYYLIDKVTSFTPGVRATGVKNVTLSDEVLHDHFPDYPVMPGALLVEAAAQLAGFLLEMTWNQGEGPPLRALLVQITRAKFHEPTGPGDRLDLEVVLDSSLSTAATVRAEIAVEGKRVASAQLMFALREITGERVHEQRRYIYRLWTRHFDPPLIIR